MLIASCPVWQSVGCHCLYNWLSFGRRSRWFNGGGRQVEVSAHSQCQECAIHCAAPLLIQDIHSWTRQGIGGCKVWCCTPCRNWMEQSIQFPGGLVGEDIYLIPERAAPDWAAETLDCPAADSSSPTPNCDCAVRLPWLRRYRNSCLAECAAIAPQTFRH